MTPVHDLVLFLYQHNISMTKSTKKNLAAVGFEPTPPKRLVPKTSALDRSATLPSQFSTFRLFILYLFIHLHCTRIKLCGVGPPLCTLFGINWGKQAQGTLR